MQQPERLEKILDMLNRDGQVDVIDLAQQFAVTEQTVRRDLATLCQRGLATRMHGGARRLASTASLSYEARRMNNIAAKSAIGRKVAELIPDACSVILNIGTTTEQVASALTKHKDLRVITNNINIISILQATPLSTLIQVGGMVRQSDGAVVGEEAVEFISRYKADYAVIGASSIDDDGAILDFDSREVAVARAILKNARTRILVADQSKFEINAPVRIADLSELDFVVMDGEPSAAFTQAAEAAGTQLLIAG
ncbi:DeoR/GlpR family DNA-binding transcription regulator [Maritalea mediterranea]|uniref:DeoR/GlpR family DNA-binding transcription regulator n=1 Tax=Maritalea mediterranea TaxID=2909667 RepID=A0ABS9EAL4_9HYPH|nr:DeoR/GlpR family DNA-binding transcription regulator [Maritalea mediterranea]MCF4098463.1 DeoR/GlpR family DNA-binding transcription regulator [Maritalea mediterranea]